MDSSTDQTLLPVAGIERQHDVIGAHADAFASELATGERHTLPLIEESLAVGKVQVDRGGVRITKRIETLEQAVETPLLRERVEIERRPVGQRIDVAPAPRQEGDTWIVPIVEEVLVTEKRLMLVEELLIRRVRTLEQHSEIVSLRREVAEIERLEPERRSGGEPI